MGDGDQERRYTQEVVTEAVRRIADDNGLGTSFELFLNQTMLVLRGLAEDGSPVGPWTLSEMAMAADYIMAPVSWHIVSRCDEVLGGGAQR